MMGTWTCMECNYTDQRKFYVCPRCEMNGVSKLDWKVVVFLISERQPMVKYFHANECNPKEKALELYDSLTRAVINGAPGAEFEENCFVCCQAISLIQVRECR